MKLLVPTDFSKNANHAAQYAAIIAEAAHAKMTLLHIITPIAISPATGGVMADDTIARTNDAIDEMKKKVIELAKSYPNAKFNYIIQQSETPSAIILKGEEEKFDLIVMGTHGATGLKKVLFGSNTVAVIQHSPVPVIAVPSDAMLVRPKRIVFATDYYFSDLQSVESLSQIAEACDAEINVVHVIEGSENEFDEKKLINNFRELVSKITAYPKFNYAVFRNKNLKAGIEDYMLAIKADLLAISTRKRGVFEKLFEKSITESLAFQPHFPMMVFHVNEEINDPDF